MVGNRMRAASARASSRSRWIMRGKTPPATPPVECLSRARCRSALETPAHGFGRNANRSDRIEQLAMRDAEMLAPPLHLPALGEIDRKSGTRRSRPRMPAPFREWAGRPHDSVPADPGVTDGVAARRVPGLLVAATASELWFISRTVMPSSCVPLAVLHHACARILVEANQTASLQDRAGGRLRALRENADLPCRKSSIRAATQKPCGAWRKRKFRVFGNYADRLERSRANAPPAGRLVVRKTSFRVPRP